MVQPNIIQLLSTSHSQVQEDFSLRTSLLNSLASNQPSVVPGKTEEDKKFSFSKRVSTIVLYDDKGLETYNSVSHIPTYYLYEDELSILKKYGDDIACRMIGLKTSVLNNNDGETDEEHKGFHHLETVDKQDPDVKQKWGDGEIGTNNFGVNGSLGLCTGCDAHGLVNPPGKPVLVELGAGSLEKTSHLLNGLSKILNIPSNENGVLVKEATYYALDLEKAQLVKALTELKANCPSIVSFSSEPPTLEDLGTVSSHLKSKTASNEYVKSSHSSGSDEEFESISTPPSTPPSPTLLDEDRDIKKVRIEGIWADYDKGFEWISQGGLEEGSEGDQGFPNPRSFLHLGSSIGNFSSIEAISFLSQISSILRPGIDKLLIGVDHCNDRQKVEAAYNDPEGVTRDWIFNGWRNVNKILLGENASAATDLGKVEYVERFNSGEGRHEAYLRVKEDRFVSVGEGQNIELKKGELIQIEVSYKWRKDEILSLFNLSNLRVVESWTTDTSRGSSYSLYLLEKPQVNWQKAGLSKENGTFGIPKLEDWESLWKNWDAVTTKIIPQEMLWERPIDLRHINLFYLGHIPTFLDIHLSRALSLPPTEPAYFLSIFERGIDPDMDDPSLIHRHSIVPDEKDKWPSLEEILGHRDRVRERLREVYKNGIEGIDRALGRSLFVGFEHEAMHLETLLYMIVQMDPASINPPPGFSIPDFNSLSKQWENEFSRMISTETETVTTFSTRTIEIGHDDNDKADDNAWEKDHEYGWDNEHPKRTVKVPSFAISLLPIMNSEYLEFLETNGNREELIPPLWAKTQDGEWGVKTVYGLVNLDYAKRWPVMASGKQLNEYAKSKGGRLPTQGELNVLYSTYPLCHSNANVGFSNWHPVPPSLPSQNRDGDNFVNFTNGGVWEWTSTVFDNYDGFTPSRLYPEYSVDFFHKDGQVDHYIVLGGSYATIPRIASRSTFVNWYQQKYGMPFAGGRVVFST